MNWIHETYLNSLLVHWIKVLLAHGHWRSTGAKGCFACCFLVHILFLKTINSSMYQACTCWRNVKWFNHFLSKTHNGFPCLISSLPVCSALFNQQQGWLMGSMMVNFLLRKFRFFVSHRPISSDQCHIVITIFPQVSYGYKKRNNQVKFYLKE